MSGPCLSSSVPDRPLRPGIRRSLGGPLPRQQADRTRTNPPATALRPPLLSRDHGVLIQVSLGYPPLPGMYPRVTHPFATRPSLYCYINNPVRLACLIHAASVRSEPESNSPKKLVLALLKASQIETVIASNHSCMRMSACSAQFSLLVF